MSDPVIKPDALDLIWGASAIAVALNLKSTRQAFWFLESGAIPSAKKVGNRWVASRKALREFFEGSGTDTNQHAREGP